MEEGPSRNHGAFTREASLLNKKKDVFASDTRSLGIFLLPNHQSWSSVYISIDLAKDFEDVLLKKKKFQNA